MDEFVINHPHNEASALISLHNSHLLAELGWSQGFWILSDEAPCEESIAALGWKQNAPPSDTDCWEVRKLRCVAAPADVVRCTDDGESMARAGAWIYIIGSHFGAKEGPLDPARHWVARFNESLVEVKKSGKLRVDLEVVNEPFWLHRIINDALKNSGIPLTDRTEADLHLVTATRKQFKKRYLDLIDYADYPLNIEAATFLPSGRMLLGLRYPVTAEGQPLCVELDGVDRFFIKKKKDGRPVPAITRVWTLDVGRRDTPCGIRELDQLGTTIHAITGNLDSEEERSAIIEGHPEGTRAHSRHYTFEAKNGGSGDKLHCHLVHDFKHQQNVEGLAVEVSGEVWYAHDDKKIRLQRKK